MLPLPFTLSSDKAKSSRQSSERLVNLYPEPKKNAKYPYVLYGTPGLVLDKTLGDGPIRGSFTRNNYQYIVSGSEVYRNGILLTGDAVTGTGPVSIDGNNNQVVIVANGAGYVVTSTVAQITDADWRKADTVAYVKGVFVFNERASGRAFSSAINDASDLDALDFATAETSPDNLRGVYREGDKLVMAGRNTLEFWYNDGGTQFPFSPILGSTADVGLHSPYGLTSIDNTFFFLGNDLAIYRMGQVPIRISTPYIERLILEAGDSYNAVAASYSRDGHIFVLFDIGTYTFVFDVSTNLWHERKSYGQSAWRCSQLWQDGAIVYAGDRDNGNVYILDENTYDENGDILEIILQTPQISNNQERFTVKKILLDVEAGAGLVSGQGSDPQVMMQFSDDGGNTWSNELWQSIGKAGEYKNKSVWHRGGRTNERIFRFSMTDPVKRAVLGLWMDA